MDSVGGIAGAAFEVAAAEVAFGLHVSDHGLDGGAASELALDDAENGALLSGNTNPAPSSRGCSMTPSTGIRSGKSRLIMTVVMHFTVSNFIAF
jgi:hypothetical protein